MKKLVFIFALGVMLVSFSACVEPGYVSEEPSYIEVSRPPRPSESHVWVAGNWVWDRHSRTYSHSGGSWMVPEGGRSYSQGYWQNNTRGHRWIAGHWH